MFTTFGFQIAFSGLCALIGILAVANYVRRRRRERALSQQPHAATTNGDIPVHQPHGHAATTWQDRTLFSPSSPSRWHGSPVIPVVEPQDVPQVATSDYQFGAATPVLASFLPETDDAKRTLARELKQAGDYSPHARENLAAARFLLLFGSLMFGGLLVLLAPKTLERPLLVGMLALTGLGWALPALLVRSRAKSRRTEIELAIPDMMDMLNMCVSQGLTVPDSIARVARDYRSVYPALAQELAIVVDQTKIGTLTEALTNFAERIDIPQVGSIVALITQTERMGTSVSDALTDYSDNMRESLRQRADERANQASFALLFPTVLCLMPAVFMFLMGPAIIELAKFSNSGGVAALNQGRQSLRGVSQQQTSGARTGAADSDQ
ncbi:MAG TPA: type II secretion system F family protein [Planctomycetaceae bacterium]|nr:type II secretion system F family protein [Planctomycetaceae bacterium]